MRAARLLHMLLILQNRGRTTAKALAEELEVSRRTILRDLDALTEAGLPVVVQPGHNGGIELGFGYRTRLTGLTDEEAEALAVMTSIPPSSLAPLGLETAARRVRSKLIEALTPAMRAKVGRTAARFGLSPSEKDDDARLPALALSVRELRVVRLDAKREPVIVHPLALRLGRAPALLDGRSGQVFARAAWRDINISAHRFERAESHDALRTRFWAEGVKDAMSPNTRGGPGDV